MFEKLSIESVRKFQTFTPFWDHVAVISRKNQNIQIANYNLHGVMAENPAGISGFCLKNQYIHTETFAKMLDLALVFKKIHDCLHKFNSPWHG